MTTLSVATPRARPLISWRVRKLLIGYSYLVPAALCMLATVVVPIVLAIKMSLYADVLYKPQDYRFTGLSNYVRLVQDAEEFRGLGVRLGHPAIRARICRSTAAA